MKKIQIFALFSIIASLQIEHHDEPCDFPAYRMRFGEICHSKILSTKEQNVHSIMLLINKANALLEVRTIDIFHSNFFNQNKTILGYQ